MVRIDVQLTPEQLAWIDRERTKSGESRPSVIRRALALLEAQTELTSRSLARGARGNFTGGRP